MTYRLTAKAEQDIIDIYVRGAAEFGVEQAERYHQSLVDIFALLTDNPRLARERTEFLPPVRLHPHDAHMIAYVIDGRGILIVRVLHGRQDWEHYLV